MSAQRSIQSALEDQRIEAGHLRSVTAVSALWQQYSDPLISKTQKQQATDTALSSASSCLGWLVNGVAYSEEGSYTVS